MRYKKTGKSLVAMVLAILLTIGSPLSVFADGDGNMEGDGSGNTGGATSSNTKWESTNAQGYRVTIVNAESGTTVKGPIDITTDSSSANMVRKHFGKFNKLNYKSGKMATETASAYKYFYVDFSLPKVVDMGTSISEVKDWFTLDTNLKTLCNYMGFDFNKLNDTANYKILVEPLIFVKYLDVMYAMTSTEAIMFAKKYEGFRYNLTSLVQKSALYCMFLETTDLGISAYKGSTSNKIATSDASKINQLGVGIVYFNNDPNGAETPPVEKPGDADKVGVYRHDFICDSITTDIDIQEENDFNADATFSYQQEIDCKYCVTTCGQCNLTGSYTVQVGNGSWTHSSRCYATPGPCIGDSECSRSEPSFVTRQC